MLKLYVSLLTDLNLHPLSLAQARVFPIGLRYHCVALLQFTLRRVRSFALANNPEAQKWKVPDFQTCVATLLPLGSSDESFSTRFYAPDGLHFSKSVTTLFVAEDGRMAWSPTLAQLRELVHPLLNFGHAKSLAELHVTRDYFPLPSGPRRSAKFDYPRIPPPAHADFPHASRACMLTQQALREVMPLLNGAPPCTIPQWASLPMDGFHLTFPVAYEHPLLPSEASPPLPRASIPITPRSDSDLEDDELDRNPDGSLDPLALECDCSPSFRQRRVPEGVVTPPPQFDHEFLHSLHGIVLIPDGGFFVQEAATPGDAQRLQRQASNLPAANHSASLAASWTIPMMDPRGDTQCHEVVHSLSAAGNLIHGWCVEPSLDPCILPHPLDATVIIALSQPLRARCTFARKVLGCWVQFPPMPNGTMCHWRLPPAHVSTYFSERCIIGSSEVADDYFAYSVVYADGSVTRDPFAYLSALGITPEDQAKLGYPDFDTLRSLFRQVLIHDAVSFEEMVRNLLLGEANACLLPTQYRGLFLGSQFSDWASSQSKDVTVVTPSSTSTSGVLNRAFHAGEGQGSSLTDEEILSSAEPSSEDEVMDMDVDVDSGTGSVYAQASDDQLQLLGQPADIRREVAQRLVEAGDLVGEDFLF